MNLDRLQRRFCNSREERIRLLAPAGSGKTLALLWRCKSIQDTNPKRPRRFLVVTFTRSARDELRDKIKNDPELQSLGNHLHINTLNAFGFRYLKNQTSGIKLISRQDAYWIMNNTLRPIWAKNRTMSALLSSSKNLNRYDEDILEAFETLKGLGFRHDAAKLLPSFHKHEAWLDEVGLKRYYENSFLSKLGKMNLVKDAKKESFIRFWAAASNHLNQSNYVTFSDQKYWALLKLENAKIAPNQRFHHILVDEFQDVDPLDMNLIKALVAINNSTLTLVGDDDQAIFEWRGAVPRFILEPETFLGGTFETHILGRNYRSPSNIVKCSQKLIKKNTVRVPKDVTSDNKSVAEIAYKEFADYQESCAFVMQLVREMKDNTNGNKIAIMGRKRAQIIPYQILLASEHIPFYAKDDLNIFLQKSFDCLCDILMAMARRNDRRRRPAEVIDDFMLLVNNVKRLPLGKSEKSPLITYLNNRRPKSLDEALDYFRGYDGPLKGGMDLSSFHEPITLLLTTESPAATLVVLGEKFQGFSKDYGKAQSLEDIFYIDPPFYHLADYAQRYGNDYDAFMDDLEKAIYYLQRNVPTDTDEERDADEAHPIHLMTALRAKGKEYHTVVILDAIDGIWPSKLAITPAEKEQERRLFYVAITRPRGRLFIISNRTVLGNSTFPSPFIKEMGLR